MFQVIQLGEATASRRRIFFRLIDSADNVSGQVIATTGVKAELSKNGAAAFASTNDITAVDPTLMPGEYYIELVSGEEDTLGTVISLCKPAGCLAGRGEATIVGYDPYAAGATAATIVDAMLARNAKGGSDGPADQSVSAALASGFLKADTTGGTLTVSYPDGTVAYTRTITRAVLDAIEKTV